MTNDRIAEIRERFKNGFKDVPDWELNTQCFRDIKFLLDELAVKELALNLIQLAGTSLGDVPFWISDARKQLAQEGKE